MAPDGQVEQSSEQVVSQLKRVSAAMTRIYKEQFGRGPERVHSHYAGRDAIVCFLENTLTPVERTLGTLDEHQRLRDMRMLFQYAAEQEFRGAVEEITGRKVVAFVSDSSFSRRRRAGVGAPLLIRPVGWGSDW